MNEVRTSVKNFPQSNARWKNLDFQCFSHFKKTIFFVLLIPLFISCSTSVTLPPPTKYEVKNMQKKEQLIEFLKRLKVALDMNILDDPKKFQEITGFEVLKWTEPNEVDPTNAEDWRFNVPAMDSEIELTKNRKTSFGVTYYPTHQNSVKGSFVVDALQLVECLNAIEVSTIYGEIRLALDRKPKPFHVIQPPPFWDAKAYIYNSSSDSLLIFNFYYEDEQNPKVTCLKSIGIRYGAKPPPSYTNRFGMN
jgi:hypothetical protein